jgi:hypothetical protein
MFVLVPPVTARILGMEIFRILYITPKAIEEGTVNEITLVNDQLDAQLFNFVIRLLHSSTRFEEHRVHHQEVKLY